MTNKEPQFPTRGVLLIYAACCSYIFCTLLNLNRFTQLLREDKEFREGFCDLFNLAKQTNVHSCFRLRLIREREIRIEKQYRYLWDHLEKYINMNVEKGLIRSDEVHFIMGFWNEKRLVPYLSEEIDFSKILKKYPRFQWGALAFLHSSDLELFQDIKEHWRKIRKTNEDFKRANGLEEERQMDRIIVFEAIALADFKMAILTLSQINYLSPEFHKESTITQQFVLRLGMIEEKLGFKLRIDRFFD